MRCRWCVGFACEVDAKNGTHNTVIPKALASGNCELRTDCVVKEILTDARGRVTGVAYFDANNRLQEQPADLVMVSASATESARLLLNSKSAMFPSGLGNRYDWVGRNLQGHAYTGAMGLMDFDIYDDLGPGASIAISDYNHGNPGLVGGAVLCNEFIRLPIHFTNMLPPGVPRWGAAHKEYMREFLQALRDRDGPDPGDAGFRGARAGRSRGEGLLGHSGGASFRASPSAGSGDRKICGRNARRRGCAKREPAKPGCDLPGPDLSGGQHQAGTCRMGNDPKTSVVDAHCKVHDVDNLFVVDASVHVTNGGFNPVLTILANAYRVSEFIAKNWKPS